MCGIMPEFVEDVIDLYESNKMLDFYIEFVNAVITDKWACVFGDRVDYIAFNYEESTITVVNKGSKSVYDMKLSVTLRSTE